VPLFRSFAKINWHLEVAGRRSDGFHELRTIFQTIDLHDDLEIEIEPGRPGIRLSVEGAELPADDRNLAWRAARAFLDGQRLTGVGARIRLLKRIPAGAGLGGGSSNAATVLLALERLLGRADPDWLASCASGLGADVPFFLLGGLALGTGRGDLLRPLADSQMPGREIWLAVPAGGALSTARVFQGMRAHRGPAEGTPVLAARSGAPLPAPSPDDYRNDLEETAMALSPQVRAVYTSLQRSGARLVRMSGSGSTLFACFDDPAAAEAVAVRLPAETVWKRVHTMGREAWFRAAGFGSVGEGV